MLNKLFHIFKYNKKLKYLPLIIIFLSCNLSAQTRVNLFKNSLNNVFSNLSSIPLLSYKLTLTTLEANKVTSSYTAEVYDNWYSDANFSLYKFTNGQIFVTYQNNLGLERFWFGRSSDLPEIQAKDIDSKLLTTGIPYSSFLINPLWLSIPIDSKEDQGFLVVQTYNKNRYSNYTKIEYYINKDNIPVRTLYYNSISNFPVVEVLVTDYKKVKNAYFIYKMEYRDNVTKKITILEKSDINFNISEPTWLETVKSLIYNNINEYLTSFLFGIRTEKDIKDTTSNTSALSEDNKEATYKDNHNNGDFLEKLYDKEPQVDIENNIRNNKLFDVPTSKIQPDSNIENKNETNGNDAFLKALNSIDNRPDKEENTIEAPKDVKQSNTQVKTKIPTNSKKNNSTKKEPLNDSTSKKKVQNKVTSKENKINKNKNDLVINKQNSKSNIPKNKDSENSLKQESTKVPLDKDNIVKPELNIDNSINKNSNDQKNDIQVKPPVKKETKNKSTKSDSLLNNFF